MFSLLFIILLMFHYALSSAADRWESVKEEFARRTREYVRSHPVSPELQAFIEQVQMENRRKRQSHNDMYAIKDGDVVPLARIEESLYTKDPNLGENYTVVPLIIPIALENNVTPRASADRDTESHFEEGSQRAILGRGSALERVKENNLLHRLEQIELKNDEQKMKEENEGKTTTKLKTSTNEPTEEVVDSLLEEKLTSTSDSTDLSKVLQDVQSLIVASKKGKMSAKEGKLCNVFGYWDSESGGMTIHIKQVKDKTVVSLKHSDPPSDEGFLIEEKWNASAHIPFHQPSQTVITVTAMRGGRVAVFLGECRICDGSETITGDWLVGRNSADCKDQKASHSFLSDVFRKNNVETLRQDHLKKITTSTPNPDIEET